MRRVILAGLLVAWAQVASAQGLRIGPCAITYGTASPEGNVVGSVCDEYRETDTGIVWEKKSGTNTNTGWEETRTGSGAGTGTVTSVGLSLPALFSVSGSPVSTSGTISVTLASQFQNLFFASPNGSAGTPTFRSILTADIADATITYAKIQDVSAGSTLLGRGDSGSGDFQEITLGSGLSMTGTTLSSTGGGGGAPTGAQYLTLATDATLTNERVATAGVGIDLVDAGAGSTLTVKLEDMAQSTIKGRAAGAGTGDPTDLTATQATAILNAFVGDSGSGGTKGLVPAPATGDSTKFLKGDGTWATVSGTLSDGDKGDVTVSASGATWTIDNDAVTYAKMQNVSAASKLLGRGDSGSGDTQEITLGTNLTMSGTTLNATGGGGLYAMTPPEAADFPTAVNSGSLTTTDVTNGVMLTQANEITQQFRGHVQTLPSTPYTITVAYDHTNIGNGQFAGMVLRESGTQEIIVFGTLWSSGVPVLIGQRWTSASGSFDSSEFTTVSPYQIDQINFLRMTDNGTNRSYFVCFDTTNCVSLGVSVGRTTFLTADQAGILIGQATTGFNNGALFYHFEVQ